MRLPALAFAIVVPFAVHAQGDGAAPDSLASFMAPGVARELAEHRAATLGDVRYALELDLTHPDTARGAVMVRVNRKGGGDLILDFRGPALDAVRVNDVAAQVEFNGAHIRVPAGALRDGANAIHLEFRTRIAAAGASIIKYQDTGDGNTYLYTLLVPADANLLFPSFDQPDLKARVSLTLRTPRGWKAVANGPLRDTTASGDAVVHRFAESEPISTYLIAFAAGPWAVVSSPTGTRPVNLFVRRSRVKEVDGDTLIAMNQRALDWLEGYFARPFPFAKYDMVLAPAFPFGGMEHRAPCSTTRWLHLPRAPTLTQRLGRQATIYHEVAHQWFGDLVTMRVVRRPVAQGGVRHLHGGEDAGRALARTRTRGRRSTCATSRWPTPSTRPPARRRSGRSSPTSTWPRATTARSSTTRRRAC
jgi:aminopeptidase N